MKAILSAVVLTGLVVSAIAAPPAPIVVFAAASLTDCLTEIGRRYQQQTGQAVRFNFGALIAA